MVGLTRQLGTSQVSLAHSPTFLLPASLGCGVLVFIVVAFKTAPEVGDLYSILGGKRLIGVGSVSEKNWRFCKFEKVECALVC